MPRTSILSIQYYIYPSIRLKISYLEWKMWCCSCLFLKWYTSGPVGTQRDKVGDTRTRAVWQCSYCTPAPALSAYPAVRSLRCCCCCLNLPVLSNKAEKSRTHVHLQVFHRSKVFFFLFFDLLRWLTCYLGLASLDLTILLPPPPELWIADVCPHA